MKILIVKQILLVSTLGNVKRTVWRIYILMLECKGLQMKNKAPYTHLADTEYIPNKEASTVI